MGSFSSLDDYISKASGSNVERVAFHKHDYVAGTQKTVMDLLGRMNSLWLMSGQPGAGVAPTTVVAPTNSTAGALGQADPGGGRQKYLVGANISITVPGGVMLYDRLLTIGSLSGTTTGAQTVGGSMTRYTGATTSIGNQIWVEIYAAVGTTATTVSASYSNEGGTSGRTTASVSFGGAGSDEQFCIIPLPLQSGDQGVTAVASVTIAASTLTAGNFGITVARPIEIFGGGGLAANPITGTYDLVDSGVPPEILSGACLAWTYGGGAVTPRFGGMLYFVEA